MRDLIKQIYNLNIDSLTPLDKVHFGQTANGYVYIIPVGSELHTLFFHLLKLIERLPTCNLLLTASGETTFELQGTLYYGLISTIPLHQQIKINQLNVPILYGAPYPVASHFKERWIQKKITHEMELEKCLNEVPNHLKSLLFDLATYYLHLNEEAHRLINKITHIPFQTSLCHGRIKPTTQLYECFSPELLLIDNKSRGYAEYMRHLFLETLDLGKVQHFIADICKQNILSPEEWQFLYSRLYFPAHFYDEVHAILTDDPANLESMYEQTLHYTDFLYHVPVFLMHKAGIQLEIPDWIKEEKPLY